MVKVLQADREAAALLLDPHLGLGWLKTKASEAFATHREEAVRELVETLNEIAGMNGGTTTNRNLAMKMLARTALAKYQENV